MADCTCDRYMIVAPTGELLEGEKTRDPCCHLHGYPDDRWRAGDPLRRHARWYRRTVWQPAILANDGTVVFGEDESISRPKLETPRETEARLYQETRGGA